SLPADDGDGLAHPNIPPSVRGGAPPAPYPHGRLGVPPEPHRRSRGALLRALSGAYPSRSSGDLSEPVRRSVYARGRRDVPTPRRKDRRRSPRIPPGLLGRGYSG